jgi:hypothetical protein
MAKISCTCGQIIFDQSDHLSWKAHLLADQDYGNFLDAVEAARWEDSARGAHAYFRDVFQCTACNDLVLFVGERRFDFAPLEREASARVLVSHRGDEWRGLLRARSRDGKGEIWWDTNKDRGFRRDLSRAELDELYYRKFEELAALDVLRDSFLTIDGETVHSYERDNEGRPAKS